MSLHHDTSQRGPIILIVNPNSTAQMTDALKPLVSRLNYNDSEYTYFTGPPSSPASINNEDDAEESAKACLSLLEPLLPHYDGILIACYSPHPLVPILKAHPAVLDRTKAITGIFEASVGAALQLRGPVTQEKGQAHPAPQQKFGIVSTGKVWEEILTTAVKEFLGTSYDLRHCPFATVETTGLDATQLHDAPAEEVRKRMKDATKRLLGAGDIGAICLGCAGMAGMDEIVREACVEELGEERGKRVRIVDGVLAGVGWLEGVVRAGM